jgi:amino acid adenylation domain-containing protein
MNITHIKKLNGLIPLTSIQKRIWFMENFDSTITAYNIPHDFKITGDLDIDILGRAIDLLIERHESMRTVFKKVNGSPVQKVLTGMQGNLSIVHLEKEPPESLAKTISNHSLANATYKFDLENGPLFRFELLAQGNFQFYFLVNFHHIIFDDESVNIFIEELISVIDSLSTGKPINLTPTTITYSDYAISQNKWLASEECRRQLEYWKKELWGYADVLQLPVDFPRPKILTYNGTAYHFMLDSDLRNRIMNISLKHGTSMSITMLTAFSTLLSRYSSQDEFVVGVPVSNRNNVELESLVGVLINTLPIRIKINEGMSFASHMEQISKNFFSAYENQEVPFEHLVEELNIKRATDISPIFQVIFNYLQQYNNKIHLPGLLIQKMEEEQASVQLDLTLTVKDHKDNLSCKLEYNTDLFRPETIERFAGHYITFLKAICSDEGQIINEIPILTEKETNQMLIEWNRTKADYPGHLCVHQVFEEQVQKTPDRVAVEFNHHQMTYSQLNMRANSLARYLVKQGAGEDKIIAVFLERGSDLPVSLLAISKTGSTYLPLDPIFPKARLEIILDDAQPVILVTQSSLLEKLPQTNAQIVFIDDPAIFDQGSVDNLGLGNPLKPVYILYTSGSTGKPKGVPIKQHSVVNLVNSYSKMINATKEDILFAVTTISFDIAEVELYLPLFSGAKIVIGSQETAMNMELLMQAIDESNATIFQATPVTFKMLIRSSWPGKKDLKIISGGEAFSKELASELLTRCKDVWNVYGPTETTIWSTSKKVSESDLTGDGYVAIGRPVDNTTLYVLNKKMVPMPIGLSGELYIGGVGLSPGYFNLPAKTAEQFVPDPFSKEPGQRLYKTGDLVRYLPDGNLVFLDRADSQVKIRGFRIELGDIESALSRFDGMKENVVIVRKDSTGEKMLAAYYILKEGSVTDHQEIRRFLAGLLPDYMIPSAYIRMDEFPLTANNKIDRKALPEPEITNTTPAKEYVTPLTMTEQKLAAIWSSLLKLKKIGVHDNFFEIGGHSMIAVSLILKIEKELGIRLPLATLFERSTIQQLAEIIDRKSEPMGWRSLVPIRPEGSKKPIFLVHGLGLNVLLYSALVNHLDPDLPVYGLQAKGLDGKEKPLQTVEDIARYYISEIMTVDPDGPYAIAGFSLGGRIAYEMAQQLTVLGKKVAFLGLFDTPVNEISSVESILFGKKSMLRYMMNYIQWNIRYFFRDSEESKLTIISRRWKGLMKKLSGIDIKLDKKELVSKGAKRELPRYLRQVHRANMKADKNYITKPYPGNVFLFKAKHQTFYNPDPVYYGWDKLAKGGVMIHEIPGEHSRIFAPPNDKYFARILEECMKSTV